MTRQRETFDQVAALYEEVRPTAPNEAVEALWRRLELAPGDPVVEVGCGTGQLTTELAARGAILVALEPGAALAERCAAKTVAHDVTVVQSTFEDWTPDAPRYRTVTACQAAHWIDPAVFLDRASRALADGGGIGLLWHLDLSEGTSFWRATQALYDRYLPDAATKPPRTLPALVAAYERALGGDPRYAPRPLERWGWSRTFDEETYVRLLRTHSPVRLLPDLERRAFLDGHADVVRTFGGRVDRHYETVLLVARRAAG